MATLAIKGHATRGSEVIGLLEMLGGKNSQNFNGFVEKFYYCIRCENYIGYQHASALNTDVYCAFTLEQFLEKYPYKVGDKVLPTCYSHPVPRVITKMWWDGSEVCYYTNNKGDEFTANELQPYTEQEEETMEEKIESFEVLESHCGNEVKIEFDPSKFEIIQRENGWYVVKKQPQYPKTYEECCDILRIPNDERYIDIDVPLSYNNLLNSFTQLLICRNAYRKIAGEQMGLDKPWKPELIDKVLWCISNYNNSIIKHRSKTEFNVLLIFPTEEMQDTFYKNFKELIEICKELL